YSPRRFLHDARRVLYCRDSLRARRSAIQPRRGAIENPDNFTDSAHGYARLVEHPEDTDFDRAVLLESLEIDGVTAASVRDPPLAIRIFAVQSIPETFVLYV